VLYFSICLKAHFRSFGRKRTSSEHLLLYRTNAMRSLTTMALSNHSWLQRFLKLQLMQRYCFSVTTWHVNPKPLSDSTIPFLASSNTFNWRLPQTQILCLMQNRHFQLNSFSCQSSSQCHFLPAQLVEQRLRLPQQNNIARKTLKQVPKSTPLITSIWISQTFQTNCF